MTQEKIHRYMKVYFINPITNAIEEGVVTNMIAKFNKEVFVVIAATKYNPALHQEVTSAVNVPLEHIFITKNECEYEYYRMKFQIAEYKKSMTDITSYINFIALHDMKHDREARIAARDMTQKLLGISPNDLAF
mgnify:CR=1 FL=1